MFSLSPLSLLAALLALGTAAAGQSAPDSPGSPSRPLSAKEKKEKEARLRRELATPWKHWLNEDVVYIATDAERRAFRTLESDEEQQGFVEQFWQRRNPTPDSLENPFEEEHYRRIAYANDRYASAIPGWKTDRGRIYVLYGPPDEIEAHPGTEGDAPSEVWRYRYIEGIGGKVEIQFVDTTRSGEYHITMDPSEKDFPSASLPLNEQLGICSPCDGTFQRTDGTQLGVSLNMLPESMQEFTRLENSVTLGKPPKVKFKDLEEVVSTNVRYNTLPMKVQVGYFRVTGATVLTPITVSFAKRDLQPRSNVNILGRVRSASRVVTTFEDVVAVGDAADLVYQRILPLAPRAYHLNLVAKDILGGTMTNYEMALNVSHFDEEKLGSSSLILADVIEKVPTHSVGAGQFAIGAYKVRPRVGNAFTAAENLGIYEQFYNFAADPKTGKLNAGIEYHVTRNDTGQNSFDYKEEIAALPSPAISQLTLDKLMPLNRFAPGNYTLEIVVTDRVRNQALISSARFTVAENLNSTLSYSNPVPVPHVSLTATGAGLRMRTVFQRIRVV